MAEKPQGSALRILFAEDNPDSRCAFATLLQLSGHEVRAVADGMEAVDALSHFEPDVAILDIGMPKLNGYEVAERISHRVPGACLVALSGWSQSEHVERSRRAGFSYHVTKPVDFDLLNSILHEASKRKAR